MVTFTPKGIGKLNKGFKENWKDIPKLFGQKQTGAPPGTVPIGDGGWYATPNDAAKPWDCNRYKGSPFCGGTGLNPTPFSLDFTPSVHKCGFDIEMSGSAFYIQMPTNKLAYRYEGECRNEPPPEPPPPPPRTSGKRVSGIPGQSNDDEGYFFIGIDIHEWGNIENNSTCVSTYGYPKYIPYEENYETNWSSAKCPGDMALNAGQLEQALVSGVWKTTNSGTDTTLDSRGSNTCIRLLGSSSVDTGDTEYNFFRNNDSYYYNVDSDGNVASRYYNNGSLVIVNPNVVPEYTIEQVHGGSSAQIFKGQWLYIKAYLSKGVPPDYAYTNIHVDFFFDLSCTPKNRYRKNPPPPNPDKDCECMACCNDPRQNSDDLLRQILNEIKKANKAIGSDQFPTTVSVFDADENKTEAQSKSERVNNLVESVKKIVERTEKVSKIIGIDTFPLELPESVIVHPENNNLFQKALDFLNPFKNVKIHSVMELLVWKIKQDSAVLGQWGQVIQVTSTEKKKVNVNGKEIEKEVEKTEEVVLPNMAQTMKEQILLQSQALKILGLTQDCVIKVLIDLAGTKQLSAESVRRIQDIQEYLDYPTREAYTDVPLQITIPSSKDREDTQNDLYKFLEMSHAKVRFDDWTGEHSMDEKIVDLLQAAKAIMAVYYQGKPM